MRVAKNLTVAALLAVTFTACQTDPASNRPKDTRSVSSNAKIEEPAPFAKATLSPTKDSKARGTVEFTTTKDGLWAEVEITGVNPGEHGFHIHEKGDCSAPDATSAGGHFNPTKKKHGAPKAGDSHLGDFGNLAAGKDGTIKYSGLIKPAKAIGDGDTKSIIGKAVILHGKPDDLTSQPSGNAGPRIACGVVAKA